MTCPIGRGVHWVPASVTVVRSDLYRAVNQRIHELTARSIDPIEFLCECGDESCLRTLIPLTRREYEQIREIRDHVLLAPGHERPGTEVVRQRDGYLVAREITAQPTGVC